MASDLDIVNDALTRLGAARLTSLTASTESARVMNMQYPLQRDALLRAYRWNFAMKRANLAADADVPVWGFSNQYRVPSDFLRLDMVGDTYVGLDLSDYRDTDNSEYSLEGPYILTNKGAPLPIRYIRQIVEAGAYDPQFVLALGCFLAINTCERITQSTTKKESIKSDLKDIITTAVRTNSIEKPPAPIPDDSWVIARLGGVSG